eukprot:TRINITY_DN15446_c0_g2_i2.p1 TRINITY_DN15446_c0_g2~~TRINITY_DN15446_c0_g2_i2.p1  ORF type:complete len:1099 (-),score=181.13 TRINITY_DN15446_c0_g2_i2:38-3334(-)
MSVIHDKSSQFFVLFVEAVHLKDANGLKGEDLKDCRLHWYAGSAQQSSRPFTLKVQSADAVKPNFCSYLVADAEKQDGDVQLSIASPAGEHIGVHFGKLKDLAKSAQFSRSKLELRHVSGVFAIATLFSAAQARWTTGKAFLRETAEYLFVPDTDAQAAYIKKHVFADGSGPGGGGTAAKKEESSNSTQSDDNDEEDEEAVGEEGAEEEEAEESEEEEVVEDEICDTKDAETEAVRNPITTNEVETPSRTSSIQLAAGNVPGVPGIAEAAAGISQLLRSERFVASTEAPDPPQPAKAPTSEPSGERSPAVRPTSASSQASRGSAGTASSSGSDSSSSSSASSTTSSPRKSSNVSNAPPKGAVVARRSVAQDSRNSRSDTGASEASYEVVRSEHHVHRASRASSHQEALVKREEAAKTGSRHSTLSDDKKVLQLQATDAVYDTATRWHSRVSGGSGTGSNEDFTAERSLERKEVVAKERASAGAAELLLAAAAAASAEQAPLAERLRNHDQAAPMNKQRRRLSSSSEAFSDEGFVEAMFASRQHSRSFAESSSQSQQPRASSRGDKTKASPAQVIHQPAYARSERPIDSRFPEDARMQDQEDSYGSRRWGGKLEAGSSLSPARGLEALSTTPGQWGGGRDLKTRLKSAWNLHSGTGAAAERVNPREVGSAEPGLWVLADGARESEDAGIATDRSQDRRSYWEEEAQPRSPPTRLSRKKVVRSTNRQPASERTPPSHVANEAARTLVTCSPGSAGRKAASETSAGRPPASLPPNGEDMWFRVLASRLTARRSPHIDSAHESRTDLRIDDVFRAVAIVMGEDGYAYLQLAHSRGYVVHDARLQRVTVMDFARAADSPRGTASWTDECCSTDLHQSILEKGAEDYAAACCSQLAGPPAESCFRIEGASALERAHSSEADAGSHAGPADRASSRQGHRSRTGQAPLQSDPPPQRRDQRPERVLRESASHRSGRNSGPVGPTPPTHQVVQAASARAGMHMGDSREQELHARSSFQYLDRQLYHAGGPARQQLHAPLVEPSRLSSSLTPMLRGDGRSSPQRREALDRARSGTSLTLRRPGAGCSQAWLSAPSVFRRMLFACCCCV